MLIGNYNVLNKNPGRFIAGSTVAGTRPNFSQTNASRNRFFGGFAESISTPVGYLPGVSWVPAYDAGGMSMRSVGTGTLTSNLYPTMAMAINFTGSGSLSATAALVVSMLLSMGGSGTLAASIQGRLNMSADLTGSGDLDASIAALGNMVCELTGTGDLEAAIGAIGNMSVDITVTGSGLTTANVGAAVWSSLASANNVTGTMGEKLNDAGSAANPWTEVIESGYTAAEILRLLAAVMAGKSTGGGTTNIEFTGLDGTTIRVDATVDESGNRSAVTLDPL
jgi:hypothetical protein